jgi:hypothetical protein
MLFDPFEINDDSDTRPWADIDPDLQYFNDMTQIDSSLACNYFIPKYFNEYIKKHEVSDSNFSILHLNIRSLPRNGSNLSDFLDNLEMKFSVVALSETWLSHNTLNLYDIENYNGEHLYRKNRTGGGVSIFVREEISYSQRTDLSVFNEILESIFIEIPKHNINTDKDVLVGVVYRPPNTDISEFNQLLSEILHKCSHESKLLYLVGDFNINLLNADNHMPTAEFLENCYTTSLFPQITKPTRLCKSTATLIDNIFVNITNSQNTLSGLFVEDISDHFPIFCINVNSKIQSKSLEVNLRNYSTRNLNNFVDLMQGVDWTSIYQTEKCQDAFTSFHSIFSNIYNKCFPIKKTSSLYESRKPWLTVALKQSIKVKNSLFIKMKTIPSCDNIQRYKKYRALLNKLLRKQERAYFREKIEQNKSNLRKTWDTIKYIINRKKKKQLPQQFNINGAIEKNPRKIAEHFNRFYINIGKSLSANIQQGSKNPLEYLQNNVQETIFIEQTNEHEISKIILGLKEGSAGWDEIQAKMVKCSFNIFLKPLTHLINLSLLQGVVPSELKRAKVIPIYKSGDPMFIKNYRPVSVLPLFSKIFERVMYDRIIKFITKHDILYKHQYGFREKHSTAMALMILTDNILSAIDQGKYYLGVFLDFSKAFDTVNHGILLNKLEQYGIRGLASKWLTSYLTGRFQFVNFNNCKSNDQLISCGVPQGSILGPLLFLLYINDIANISNLLTPILFADDSSLFISGNNLEQIINNLNSELQKVKNWVDANKLTLNIEKSYFMVFSSGRKKVMGNLHVSIDGKGVKKWILLSSQV